MTAQVVAADATSDPTVEFFGSTGTMTGTVALRNVTDGRVRLRRTVPRVCSDLSGTGTPLLAHVARRSVLDPSGVGQVPVRLRIPQHTAPGDYQVQVDVGGVVHQAVLHVLEDVAVTVSPEEVVIAGGSEPQERRVAVSNDGNVAVTVGSLAVPLDDDLLDCRSLRGGAKEFSESGVRFDDFLSAVVRQGNRALQRAGILRMRVPGGEVTVEPGQTVLVPLMFQVPNTLDRHTRYSAVVPVATADLRVHVVPGLRAPRANGELPGTDDGDSGDTGGGDTGGDASVQPPPASAATPARTTIKSAAKAATKTPTKAATKTAAKTPTKTAAKAPTKGATKTGTKAPTKSETKAAAKRSAPTG